MIFTIGLFIFLTLAAVIWGLAPQLAESRVLFQQTPDRPAGFGYRMAWLAIRSRDPKAVAEALGLHDATPCNWNSGIGTVYDRKLGESHVYVTPPVNGWVFVVGLPLPHPAGPAFLDKCTPLLVGLGGRFVEVQYFFSYPPIDMFAWARMIEGRLMRAFATGDEGVIWNKGKTSREERDLGLKMFELRGVKGRRGDAGGEIILHPTEDHVMRLAHRWSLDPTLLDTAKVEPSLGYIASAPIAWRVERVRRSA